MSLESPEKMSGKAIIGTAWVAIPYEYTCRWIARFLYICTASPKYSTEISVCATEINEISVNFWLIILYFLLCSGNAYIIPPHSISNENPGK